MPSTFNSWLVGLSIAVAVLVSYTSLRLAARVAVSERPQARIWLAAGAIAMGVGVWSMHFIGMLAFSMRIPLQYNIPITLASLAISIATSGFALAITSGQRLTWPRLSGGAMAMGAGIASMHYMGMAAIVIAPSIAYDWGLVALSVIIAIAASFVALWLFFRLREGNSMVQRLARIGAAVIMGLAISGMHYTAMAAARFDQNSICTGGVTFDNHWLATTIGIFTFGLLLLALVTTMYDAHLESRSRTHAQRLQQANAELQHQATHDALTSLPNRVLFMDRLGREIAHGERDQGHFAVLAVDLDRFKTINDTLGHGVGDQLLVQVAQRLVNTIRVVDTVARVGGDEFLLLINGVRDQANLSSVAAKINAQISKSFLIGTAEIHTSASIGISVYPEDGPLADALVAHADEAMYFSKQRGSNTFQFFNSEMSVFSQERLNLENDLRRALPSKQFEVQYQPKMDVATGRMNSVEALLRWHHPTRGLVSPVEFIRLAEETGLIISINEWVLREACRQALSWQTQGLPLIRVAVNISPIYFRQLGFLGVVRSALSDNNLEPRFLEIELTETTVMDQAESSVSILEELSRMGVIVSIDDFGTGYSSMSYLRRFPIDKLKVDRSFINDLTTNADAASIVKAIVSLAHSLRLKVVAEGVETAEQLQQLKDFGCDQYQGFLRSPAELPEEIAKYARLGLEAASDTGEDRFMRTYSKLAAFKPR